jgi:hypothetical protein
MTARDERLNRPGDPKKGLITTALALVVVVLVAALIGHHSANPGHPPASFTLAEYRELRPGLSYVQVGDIVGRGGQLGNGISSDPAQVTRIVLQNKDMSSMTLTFQNGALIAKTQAGLH